MVPARNFGVFVAFNTDSGASARDEFMQAFFDRHFPTPLPKEPAPVKDSRARLERFTGTYALSRVSESDLTRIVKLVAAASVAVDADGYLVMRRAGEPTRWRQVEPLVFAQVDGLRQLVFREDERGEIAQLCTSPFCVVAMLKQPWWKGIVPQMVWLGVCAAVLVSGLIGVPINAVLQRKVRMPIGSKMAHLLAWTTSLALAVGLDDSDDQPRGLEPDRLRHAVGNAPSGPHALRRRNGALCRPGRRDDRRVEARLVAHGGSRLSDVGVGCRAGDRGLALSVESHRMEALMRPNVVLFRVSLQGPGSTRSDRFSRPGMRRNSDRSRHTNRDLLDRVIAVTQPVPLGTLGLSPPGQIRRTRAEDEST